MPDMVTGAAKIKVIGVGGGGNNAVNRMIDSGIQSAEFVAVNTDLQALSLSKAPTKIQIGVKLTGGLGAGALPEVGEKAAEESQEELREQLKDVDLLFIAAGMGGGTGTGAAPVIAKLSRDMGILTIAVVTKPFPFEHQKRMANAIEGINKLRNYVDTLLVVPNAKLLEVLPPKTPVVQSFLKADEVLRQAVQSLSDLIVIPSIINLDFADVCTTMKRKGLAHIGLGVGEGEDKMIQAVRNAVESPLLDTNISGATDVILNVVGGDDLAIDEVSDAANLVKDVIDPNGNVIFGIGYDKNLTNSAVVTLIATGFERTGAEDDSVIGMPQRAADESGKKRLEDAFRRFGQSHSTNVTRDDNNSLGGSSARLDEQSKRNNSTVDSLYGRRDNGYQDPRRTQQPYDDRRGGYDNRYDNRYDGGRGYDNGRGYDDRYGDRGYDRGYNQRPAERTNGYDNAPEQKPEDRKSSVNIPPFMRMLRGKKQ